MHKKPKSEIRISSQYYLYTKLQGITCFYIPLNIGPNREKEVKKNKEMKWKSNGEKMKTKKLELVGIYFLTREKKIKNIKKIPEKKVYKTVHFDQ